VTPTLLRACEVNTAWKGLIYRSITAFNFGRNRSLSSVLMKNFNTRLQARKFTSFDAILQRFRYLRTLDLSGCRWALTEFGVTNATISRLSTLTSLSLNSGDLGNSAIRGLSGLKSLELHMAGNISIEGINVLTNLDSLALRDCNFIMLAGIASLSFLRSLTISGVSKLLRSIE
jgi:hypothetical protein